MKKYGLIFIFFPIWSFTQPVSIHFTARYNAQPLVLGKPYHLKNNTTLYLDVVKIYVSFPGLDTNYYLLDLEKKESLHIELPEKRTPCNIRLRIGVDSLDNHRAEMVHALDPLQGMYWAWQSGFINWKIEGRVRSEQGQVRAFQWHIGGFLAPDQSVQELDIVLNRNTQSIEIPLIRFIESKIPDEISSIMSPGPEARKLSEEFAEYIKTANEIH